VYRVRTGPDANGDDRIDAARETERQLWRGAETPIELPPCKTWIWEARQLRQASPLRQRPDVAVTTEDATWGKDGSLTVRVHNIGCVAVQDLSIALKGADGRTLERKTSARLDPPLDFRPRLSEVRFGPVPRTAAGATVTVELDPEGKLLEITRANNAARIGCGR